MSMASSGHGIPPLPRSLPDDTPHQVANRLHSIAIHVLRAARAEDAAAGLTPERLSLLSVLVYGGPATLGALAAAEQVTPPAITRSVSALVQDGLVRREPVAGDRRAVLVRATPAGRRLVEAGRRRRVRRIAALLGGLSPAELAALDRGLQALARDR
jgi:DNA-binding MarR family transcriptional regulator